MFSLLPVSISLEAMTGERWVERVRLFETVAELKRRIWRRKGIVPPRQALIHRGCALPDGMELDAVGIRDGSCIKLVVITRSGPANQRGDMDEVQAMSDEPSDRELHRRGQRGCSAPEDTSAKESSAGETEREGDEEAADRRLARMAETSATGRNPRRVRTNSQGQALGAAGRGVDRLSNSGDEADGAECSHPTEKEDAEDQNHERNMSRVPCVEEDSVVSEEEEDLSEVSSGMITCDLSNEFRKLKVRRHRHPALPATSRLRARSKPRDSRHVSSSEDNEGLGDAPPMLAAVPSRRYFSSRGARLGVRSQTGGRCNTCAFRIANPFYCRCGKTLCSRHRSAQAHTCAKLRQSKLQQVSD